DEPFEYWDTSDRFDYIITTNTLDHGELGFHVLPKIYRLLKPGGRLYLHVHLRPPDLINILHDHALTMEQFFASVQDTRWTTVERKIYNSDVDGNFCQALVAILRRPV